MTPDTTAERRPQPESGAQQISPTATIPVRADVLALCPCGCRTRLPWVDDPDCIRHRPLPAVRDWPNYDVRTLGLEPHDRRLCARCQDGEAA